MTSVVLTTDLPLPLLRRGKVRDVYDLGDSLLIVATDRISAFDVVLWPGIPGKGAILTQLSNFWFARFGDVENHLIERDFLRFPASLQRHRLLQGRSVIVKRCEVVPVECVARGYLAGSGLKEYDKSGSVCGIPLPRGLVTASRLPSPIFTPATKAASGHDQNISFETMEKMVGSVLARGLRELTLSLYQRAEEHALSRGVIIADTKFEFGLLDGRVLWIDEALTPDSSRFWPLDRYAIGSNPPSFDKQFVRDWLESIGWNKEPPAPELPAEVVALTRAKYVEAYQQITGREFAGC